jgi:hypothetical protein
MAPDLGLRLIAGPLVILKPGLPSLVDRLGTYWERHCANPVSAPMSR